MNESTKVHTFESRNRGDIIEVYGLGISALHVMGYAREPAGLMHQHIDPLE
jgi:hypothetical protein